MIVVVAQSTFHKQRKISLYVFGKETSFLVAAKSTKKKSENTNVATLLTATAKRESRLGDDRVVVVVVVVFIGGSVQYYDQHHRLVSIFAHRSNKQCVRSKTNFDENVCDVEREFTSSCRRWGGRE